MYLYIYALRGFVLNDPERWYGFYEFCGKTSGQFSYDYEEENRFARRADPAANPDGFQVPLVKPSQFEEAQVIADSFGAGQVIVLNLTRAAREPLPGGCWIFPAAPLMPETARWSISQTTLT